MKRIVSVSLGTSKRDKRQEIEILGEKFLIERIGTDGDTKKFAQMFKDLDGKVDALGVGGADIYLVSGTKRYAFRQVLRWVSGAKITPVVDGSGLKHTLERETIRTLQRDGVVGFKKERVLLVSAVDRFGMAQALVEAGADCIFGDLLFGLGIKIPLRTYKAVRRAAAILLPIVTRLPIQWFYPTGEKQEQRKPKYPQVFDWATFVCGDWHYIRRYAPDNLQGKTILTQTLRRADLEWLKQTGARRAITTTPVMGGETFATNVMEAVIVAILGKRPEELSEKDYLDALKRLDWKPNVIPLNEPAAEPPKAAEKVGS
ncbi:MAG: quinate 5-dehydrogenase [Fimbriimonas ginsengisoli]|uniref:Quinate 5-dehydrogenase n=1 Tax=Fimbriimonas ginsengisoli TaxID=1005039 RepID=A0A931LWR6_FIMGI|nr:quinate 5-dehydrogenase [Fimbriimonas ginsengisoli]